MQIYLLIVVSGGKIEDHWGTDTNSIQGVHHLGDAAVISLCSVTDGIGATEAHREVAVDGIVGSYGIPCSNDDRINMMTTSHKLHVQQLQYMCGQRCYFHCLGMRDIGAAVYGVLERIVREIVYTSVAHNDIHSDTAGVIAEGVAARRPVQRGVVFGNTDKVDVYLLLRTRATQHAVVNPDVGAAFLSGTRSRVA